MALQIRQCPTCLKIIDEINALDNYNSPLYPPLLKSSAFTLFVLIFCCHQVRVNCLYGGHLPLLVHHHLGALEQIDQKQPPNNRYTTIIDPIPLRAFTVLLNYERMISDPRFKDVKLLKSSTFVQQIEV
jgi:hypothetical protein